MAALCFGLLLAVVLICGVRLADSYSARDGYIELARARVTGEAASMAEQLVATLRVIDSSLSGLINSLQSGNLLPDTLPETFSPEATELLSAHLLEHSLALAPQALEFVIMDESGRLLASSAPWATHINEHMSESPDRLVRKFFERASSILPFSLEDKPGQYLLYCRLLPGMEGPVYFMAGAVIAVGQLNPQLAATPLTGQVTHSLLDFDNTLLASWPLDLPSHYATLLRAAEFSPDDPLARDTISPWQFAVNLEDVLVVVSGMRFFPMSLFSAVGHEAVLAPWRERVRDAAVLFGCVLALFAVCAFWLRRAVRRYTAAQRAERLGQERYRDLLEHFPTGAIMLFDASMRCVMAKGLGLQSLGLADGKMEGALPREALPGNTGRTLETHLRKALNGARVSFTLQANERYYELFILPVPGKRDRGGPSHCMAVFTDITQREISRQALRQSETRYRTLARNMPDGIAFLFNEDLRILLADGRSMADFCRPGIPPVPPENATLLDILAENLLERLEQPCRAAFRGKTATLELEANGRYFEVNIEPIPGGRGSILQTLLMARDISGRKRFEEAILQARDAAESANRMKSQFVATISHELRTPVTGILGMAEAGLAQPPGSAQAGILEKIGKVAKNLSSLINDLLDFSRVEAGKLSLMPEECDIRALLESALEPLHLSAREKRLALRLHVAPTVPAVIMADPVRLGQVLLNLVGNAVKFTESGWVRLGVSLEGAPGVNAAFEPDNAFEPDSTLEPDNAEKQHADHPAILRFEVEDTGPGIPEAAQQLIFESFTQAEEGYVRSHSGSGLGLAICRQLVDMWHGRIGVSSHEGRGSLFWFTLPLEAAVPGRPEAAQGVAQDTAAHTERHAESSAPSLDAAAAPAQQASAGCAAEVSLRVLIAEDNELIREFLTMFLEEQGHQALCARDGAEALELLEGPAAEADIILMDVQMRRMSGLEATRRIRASEKNWAALPIIGLTAYAGASERESFLQAGMTAVLAKPVTREDLNAAIRQYGALRQHGTPRPHGQ